MIISKRGSALLSAAGIAALTILGSGAASAQGLALGQERASVSKSDLVAARGQNASERVQNLLAARGKDRATQRSVVLRNEFSGVNDRKFARFEQQVNGLRVHGAYVKAAFNADGEMIHFIERLAPANARVKKPTINAAAALQTAIEKNFGANVIAPGQVSKEQAVTTFADSDFFHAAPTVERVVVARGSALEEGFLVKTWSEADNLLYHTLIDGIGQVVSSELRTADDGYNIFPIHPGTTPQTLVNGPDAGNAQSPLGWLAGSQTSRQIVGNNVSAYLDQDSNNASDGGGFAVTDGNFVTAADLAQDPRNGLNPDVSVQNIFYFSNVAHDRLYSHGFVEAAGNFQEDNFGNGGLGSDSLNAEALDGSGTNNANFATPSDGSNPRMQMFLTTLASPNRDTGIDSDVVWHEYGHGLTWRMIGSMSGSISGALGEGASDTLAIIVTDEDRVGEWSFNDPDGIRSARYATNPKTLASFTGNSVHGDGEIYASAMWDVFSLYKANGLTANDMMDDFVGGMNFTPAGPDYLDMRDGLLAQAPTDRDCLIWEAYAGHGMGEGASMTIRTGGNPRNRIQITESFTVPTACQGGGGGGNTAPTAFFADSCTDLTCTFTDQSTDTDGSVTGWAWSFGDGAVSSAQNPSHTYGADGIYTVELTVTDDGGATASTTTSVTVTDGSTPPPPAGLTASVTAQKIQGRKNWDYSWSGSTATNVDIYLDGTIAATTANDGAFTLSTEQKGGGSHTHQVCEAGSTSVCSGIVGTTF